VDTETACLNFFRRHGIALTVVGGAFVVGSVSYFDSTGTTRNTSKGTKIIVTGIAMAKEMRFCTKSGPEKGRWVFLLQSKTTPFIRSD